MTAVARRAVVKTKSLPSPIGGWNARDALANMDSLDAVIMDNIFPRTSDVMLRKGYSEFATGFAAQVESLCTYNGPASQKLLAISNGNIYDITSGGAIPAASVSGLSNSKWEHVNISTSGGNYMYLVNGVDSPRLYDGSTFTTITGVSTPSITGVTTSTLVHLNLFKRRLWFVQKETLKIWYLPVDAVGGAAAALDFSSIARLGGYLVAMATWTLDAGEGMDDYAVFITSQGEIIIYKGTDPSSADTWALVGVYRVGAPIGRRCFEKYGGDVVIITNDGILPLSKTLLSSRVDTKAALTDKIQQAMNDAAVDYGSNFGWETCYYPKGSMLMLNVPVNTSTGQHQYTMNSLTGSWCRFTGWGAQCWEIFQDEPYFGSSDFVGKAWNTNADDSSDINGDILQAYNYFGDRARLKNWKMMRPTFLSSGSPAYTIGINIDFNSSAPISTPTFNPIIYGLWGSGLWGSALWGSSSSVTTAWQTISGIGYCAGIRIRVQAQNISVRWVATDVIYEYGGYI